MLYRHRKTVLLVIVVIFGCVFLSGLLSPESHPVRPSATGSLATNRRHRVMDTHPPSKAAAAVPPVDIAAPAVAAEPVVVAEKAANPLEALLDETAATAKGTTAYRNCPGRAASILDEAAANIPVAFDDTATAMGKVVCSNQFYTDPSDAPSPRLVYVDDEATAGLGSRWLRMTSAFVDAIMNKQPLLQMAQGNWVYTDRTKCPKRTHDCYFAPTTNLTQLSYSEFHRLPREYLQYSRRSLDHSRSGGWRVNWIHEQGYLNGRSGCWFTAQLLRFLLHPLPSVDDQVRATRQSLFPNGKQCDVAIHVRHGDKGREAKLHPWSEYASVLEERLNTQARRAEGVRPVVLLVTEDQSVVDEARRTLGAKYDFIVTDYPRPNTAIDRAIATAHLNGGLEALNGITNLFLGIDCGAFIGTFSSTWSRLHVLLHYAKYGCLPPMYSLDPEEGDAPGLRWADDWGFAACTSAELKADLALHRDPALSPVCARRWDAFTYGDLD